MGCAGVGIGGKSPAGASDAKFNPFWAKAEELGVLVFIHPQGELRLNCSSASTAMAI